VKTGLFVDTIPSCDGRTDRIAVASTALSIVVGCKKHKFTYAVGAESARRSSLKSVELFSVLKIVEFC